MKCTVCAERIIPGKDAQLKCRTCTAKMHLSCTTVTDNGAFCSDHAGERVGRMDCPAPSPDQRAQA